MWGVWSCFQGSNYNCNLHNHWISFAFSVLWLRENSVSQAVELWLVDKAVLPIENSVGGSIHRNYDLLLRHRLHIVGEVQLQVNHCLLGFPGSKKEQIKRVFSHPQVGTLFSRSLAITLLLSLRKWKCCRKMLTVFLTHSHGTLRFGSQFQKCKSNTCLSFKTQSNSKNGGFNCKSRNEWKWVLI